MSRFTEDDAIKALLKELVNAYKRIPFGFMDDAAAITLGNKWILIKVDGTSIQGSRYPWMSLGDLAYRVIAGAVTDVIAKGGYPVAVATSLGIPPDMDLKDLKEMGRGIRDFLEEHKIPYAGGDINSSDKSGWIDAVVIGLADNVISNRPFEAGDKVCVTGCLGLSSIPAIIHYTGRGKEYLPKVARKISRPKIPAEFLRIACSAKASTDVSDGLESLRKVLRLNGVGLKLYKQVPICPEVREFMEMFGVSLKEILAFMGEEYVIVFVPKDECPAQCHVIGEVIEEPAGEVVLEGRALEGGWDNFRGFLK